MILVLAITIIRFIPDYFTKLRETDMWHHVLGISASMWLIIYLELAKTEDGKNWANQVFEKAKSEYHPLTKLWVQNVLYN